MNMILIAIMLTFLKSTCTAQNTTKNFGTKLREKYLDDFIKNFANKFNHLKYNNRTTPFNKKIIHKTLNGLFAEQIERNLEYIIMSHLLSEDSELVLKNKEFNQGNLTLNFGNKECSLDGILKIPKSTCPWHIELRFRKNVYPHMRAFAKCNCEKCLDPINDFLSLEKCEPVYTLMPALINVKSKWNFIMEYVPTACHCIVEENIHR
ncbi:unnamed protein product [Brachionus calyciflorus]|uniref:Uncharacterized protein n=1 Tax=Brachionus calyciflorus TaxID=104777 RepID=A0A814I4G6_9BILA|nr:unnamed protein product [Brachionus calyciflorus]